MSENENMYKWCVKDILGLSCAVLTWILLCYTEWMILFVIFLPENYTFSYRFCHLIFFHFLQILSTVSHCRTMFSNPGTVPLNNARLEDESNLNRCRTCLSIKPLRAHHCRICQRCIKRLDHHCTFVNNCIGENNHKYFFLFTSYTCLLAIYVLFVSYIHLSTCVRSKWIACPVWSPPIALILLIILALLGFCFFLFTAIMTGIQIYCIYTDTPGVDFYKGRKSFRRSKPFFSSLKSIFGSQVGLGWLNPLTKPIYLIAQNDEHITFNTEDE